MAVKPQQIKRLGLSAKHVEKVIDQALLTQDDLSFTDNEITLLLAFTAIIPLSEQLILSDEYLKAGWEDFLMVYGGIIAGLHSYNVTLTYTGIGKPTAIK